MRIRSALAAALAAILVLGACNSATSPSTSPAGSVAPGTATAGSGASSHPATLAPSGAIASVLPSELPTVSEACQAQNIKTKKPGTLTVSTDNPAFPPWFEGDVPKGSDWASFGGYPPSGQGFESALAYAIADALGFTKDQVVWVSQSAFGQAFKPGKKDFDFHVGQVSVLPGRAKAVDFSDGYLDISQGVVALAANDIAKVTDLAGLKVFVLGAAQGTTALDAIENIIKPTKDPKVYPDNDKAVTALKNGQIDGLVADLDTAFEIKGAELTKGTVVGQLATPEQEHFGAVLEKGSSLTECVNQAIAVIKADGTWQSIFDQWIGTANAAPVLK